LIRPQPATEGLLRIDARRIASPAIFSAFTAEREIKLQRSPARAALPVEANFVLMVLSYL